MIAPKQPRHSTFFIDESGAKASAGTFFVVAGVKLLQPGRLQRRVEQLRHEERYTEEFKFSRINRDRLRVFRRLVEVVAESDARLVGAVVDRSQIENPFKSGDEEWQVHARIAAQVLAGNIANGEHAAAILDHRSTKPNVSFGDTVRSMANRRMKSACLVSAVTVDSEANDLLQVADLVAGAICNQRRDPHPATIGHKARVATDLAQAFGVPHFCEDVRSGRVNIKTMTRMGRGHQPS